jgi:hypothetical protein
MVVLTRRQTRELEELQKNSSKEQEGQSCWSDQPTTTVLTPKNTTTSSFTDMKGSAKKGVLSHPLSLLQQSHSRYSSGNSNNTTQGNCKESGNLGGGQCSTEENATISADPVVSIATISYPTVEELEPINVEGEDVVVKVQEIENQILEELGSSEWTVVCSGMNQLRRLAVYEPERCGILLREYKEVVVSSALTKGIKSPRSALSKSAIITCRDLFTYVPDTYMKEYLDNSSTDVLNQLLVKAGSMDKRFVVEEAVRALDAMATSLTGADVMSAILPYLSHKNPKIRGKSYGIFYRAMQGNVLDIQEVGMRSVIECCAHGVTDNTPEARDGSRAVMQCLMDSSSALVQRMKDELMEIDSVDSVEWMSEFQYDPVVGTYVIAVLGPSKAAAFLKSLKYI